MTRVDPNHITVEYELWNAVCVEQASLPGCAAISAHYNFEKGPDGKWFTQNWDRTEFPTTDMYRMEGGSWARFYHTDEANWWNLRWERSAPDLFQEKMNDPLPPGCNRA